MKAPLMAYEARPIADLKPSPNNARTHSGPQIAKISASLREYGFVNPIIIDKDNNIIAGHGRLEAAKAIGMEQVPTLRADHLTAAQLRAYMLADNRMALDAGWDDDILKVELAALKIENFDLSLTGFDKIEIDGLLKPPALGDEDATPEPPAVPVSVLGDVWLLDTHRVMCGDSTDKNAVGALMGGGAADMAFTDPPYNVAYSGRGNNDLGTIENDDMPDDKFEQFLSAVMECLSGALKPLAPVYVCHPDAQTAPKLAFEKTFADYFRKSATIIWCKQSAGMGWQDYRSQHEPIIYGWKKGEGKHFFIKDRTKTTVWNIGRDSQASYVHPTQKPVSLPSEAIMNSSLPGHVVIDLFGGSGSTLIACEKINRSGRIMELDPAYVDVIVKRWESFTGQTARHENGKTFKEIENERQG